MKNIFITLFLLFIHFQSNAQSYLWAYSAGYSSESQLTSIKRDHSGDLYLSSIVDSSGQILNARLEKRNSSQTILWNLDLPGGAVITDVEINSQNHAIISGYYTGELIVGTDTLYSPLMISAFLIETFDNGNIFWKVSFNPANDDFKPVDLFIDGGDNLYLTAELAGASSHGFCSFHKLDMWGVPMQDEFNDNIDNRTFSHILVDNTGNVYLSGTCSNLATFDSLTVPSFQYQNFLVKYDSNFNAQWIIAREYITFDHNNGLGSDWQSLYWSFLEATQLSDSIKRIKTDFNGQILIENNGPLLNSFFPTITMGTDSSGNSVLLSSVFNSIFLFRYDNQFNLLWEDTLVAQVSGFPPQIQVACYDSTFYIGSRYYSDSLYFDSLLLINPHSTIFDADIFISKWGYPEPVSVSSLKGNSSINFYPNPADEKIRFYYPENNPAVLTVMDYQSKIYLKHNLSTKGNHEIDLSLIASGLYFINITGKDFSFYNKIAIQH